MTNRPISTIPASRRSLARGGHLRRHARRLSSLAAVALSLVVVAGATPASAATYRASLGPVAATLTYRGSDTNPHGTTITVTNAGRVVFRGPVVTKFCGRLCWPEATYYPNNGNPLSVVRLEPGLPDVVLGLYSGGAHCCSIDLIFERRTPTTFAPVEVYLGDPGARLEKLPGSPYDAIVTADDSFAYEFTDYAASGLPLEIERLSNGHVHNVTRQYPALIKKDAQVFLSAFLAQASSHYQDSVGVIAAWAADEYLLGRATAANQYLRQQAAAGHLNSALEPSLKGEAFITQLHAFLKKQGY